MHAVNSDPGLPVDTAYLWTMSDGDGTDEYVGRAAAQSATGRLLARFALSECCPVLLRDWEFGRDRRGKPFIVAPPEYRGISFSISHTDGLLACLISGYETAAVDVERIRSSDDLPRLAPQLLSISEQRSLATLDGGAWLRRFFEYWTLKEAYATALGLGLAFDFALASFEVDADGVAARFAAAADGDPATWAFRRLALGPNWAGAVAVRTGPSKTCRLVHAELTSDLRVREVSQVSC
jgi:4'-phosphopantetheinyl transferase